MHLANFKFPDFYKLVSPRRQLWGVIEGDTDIRCLGGVESVERHGNAQRCGPGDLQVSVELHSSLAADLHLIQSTCR